MRSTKERLRAVFGEHCCGKDRTLDNVSFQRLCRRLPKLYSAQLTPNDADLVFARVVPRHERRIDFARFLEALALLAERKSPDAFPVDAFADFVVTHVTADESTRESVLGELRRDAA